MPTSLTQQEAAMSSRIFWLVLDDFTAINDVPNLSGTYEPIWPRHLSDRVRQVENPLPRSRTNLFNHRLKPALFPTIEMAPLYSRT